MGQRIAAIALTALLAVGMTGCASGNNATVDRYNDRNWNMQGNNVIDGVEDTVENAVDDAGDMLRGDNNRYREMVENGRVHDSDGNLWDGENRHD